MKKILYLAGAGFMALASCQQQSGYTIKGTIDGAKDGETVYLQDFAGYELIKKDSTIVKNGAFEFKGTPDSVTTMRYVTYAQDENQPLMMAMVFIENGNITLKMNQEANVVSGTKCNDAYQNFMTQYLDINMSMRELYNKMKSDATLTADKRVEMEAELNRKDSLGTAMVFNAIEQNISNLVGVHLLTSFAPTFAPEKVMPLLDQIPAAYASLPEVKGMKEEMAAVASTMVGKPFVDIVQNTPDGKELKLSDIVSANKYTLVDFWASWCGPCRREMPSVVEAYKTYKAKGLEVVGVSLDNDMAAWKKAITDLNITWPQMSDLKGWQNAGAALYGVRSIPATVLINQEGKIVARNLRGEELLTKLEELMK